MLGRPLKPRFWGYATTPADNGTQASTPVTLTPPANMLAGDLVYCSFLRAGGGPETGSFSNTGGQSWTIVKDRASVLPEIWTAWCTFNGTWSANPAFATTGTSVARSGQMFVFRPNKVGAVWAVDQNPAQTSGTAGAFVTTVTGVTNTKNKSITICRLVVSIAAILYQSRSPLNWVVMGTNFRNTSANNKNMMYAWLYQPTPGATGNLDWTLDTSGATTYRQMESFYYV